MLEIAYEHLREFPEIVHTICRMYPERIGNSQVASKDIALCQKLINEIPNPNKSIYFLDNLTSFDEDVLSDPIVIENTSKILADKLLSTPRYRFDYKDPNILLDNIFSCKLPHNLITSIAFSELITIDPIYLIKLRQSQSSKKINMLFELKRSLIKYSNRYGVSSGAEYEGKDVLTKPDEKTKKLLRCLEYHKNNYQL